MRHAIKHFGHVEGDLNGLFSIGQIEEIKSLLKNSVLGPTN